MAADSPNTHTASDAGLSMETARDAWWAGLSRRGDPARMPNAAGPMAAFAAGWAALSASHTDAAAGWATKARDLISGTADAPLRSYEWENRLGDLLADISTLDGQAAIARRRMAAGEGTGAVAVSQIAEPIQSKALGDDGGSKGSTPHAGQSSVGVDPTTLRAGDMLWIEAKITDVSTRHPGDVSVIFAGTDRARLGPGSLARAQAATAPAGGGATFEALRKIKLVALTAGAPGELPVPRAFSRIIRLCIDAGVAEKLPDLRAAASQGCDRPPEGWTCSRTPGHDGPCAASPTPDAPAKPGPGGEGVKRVRDWIERVISEDRQRNEMLAALDAALAAAPADAALRSAIIEACRFHGAEYALVIADRALAALTTAAPADGVPEVEA